MLWLQAGNYWLFSNECSLHYTFQLSAIIYIHKQVCTCTNTHHPSFLCNLLLFFELILDLSWVQQRFSPSAYYQSASSLTFREEKDKRGESRTVGEEEERRLFQLFMWNNNESWRQVWPFREIPFLSYGLQLLSWLSPLHTVLVALPVAQIAGFWEARSCFILLGVFSPFLVLLKSHICLSHIKWWTGLLSN